MINPSNKALFKLIGITVVLISIISWITIYINGIDEESNRILIRWSAKIAAILFAIAFGISSVHYFFPNKIFKNILSWRPFIGVAFVVCHSAHLLFLIFLQVNIHPVFTLAKTSSLIAGTTAYILMYLMCLTTFPVFKSRVSNRLWKALHLVGGYWIWLIFFNSYLKNVLNKGQYHFLFALFLSVLLFRLAKQIHKRTIN